MAIWAVVPAAGRGSRMHSEIPKQYMRLQGQSVLNLTLSRLHAMAQIQGIVVALDTADLQQAGSLWSQQPLANEARILTCIGGKDRYLSVLNALDRLSTLVAADDWVLVHDAARPCVRTADIVRLMETLEPDPCGGLLAAPVRDTLKLADAEGRVSSTLDRRQVWMALTPQMFRYGLLRQALQLAAEKDIAVTDEASAMESLGYSPLLVPGAADNLKITHPEDLQLAAMILEAQDREHT
ncbi:MAG: 2-C-methyl-D-erythritol 4-phosphate cytidylyltransferase [Pseudomonadales bacterium]|nr:2-C-methyl-D-erythritol 4-phosphate cytidylyltransferase [Pseudomonadales bacterium]